MSKKNLKEPYNSLEYEYKHDVSPEYYYVLVRYRYPKKPFYQMYFVVVFWLFVLSR